MLAELEDALAAVRADMRATGLAGPVRLAFEDKGGSYLRNVFADFRGSALDRRCGGTQARGRVRVKRVPSPGSLATVSVPACARASSAAMARPIPLPEVWAAA